MRENVRNGLPPWRTSFLLWSFLSASLVILVAWIRLGLFHDRLVPLAYSLPLLIVLIHRRRTLLYVMAVLLTVISIVKTYVAIPWTSLPEGHQYVALSMMFTSIWVEAVVLDFLVRSRSRLEAHSAALEKANQELAAREEEIAQQNEELQSQSEELQQQNEELQQQSEEQQQQSEELQLVGEELRDINAALRRRQRGLESLVLCARSLASDLREAAVMKQLCDALVELAGEGAVAAAIIEARPGQLHLRGCTGFRPESTDVWTTGSSFAQIIMATGRTAALPDTTLRPDLTLPRPAADGVNAEFRSVLGAPLRVSGKIVGVLEVYGMQPHEWTAEAFHVVEWFAAQAALILEAMELYAELDRRRAEAVEASLRKTRFLAAVSHDVRTPVNAINLMAEVISRASEAPDFVARVPELARELMANARSLADLVTEVLDVARFDSGQIEIQPSQFSLADFVAAEVRQLRPLAQSKRIELAVTLPTDPILLQTDRIKLARVAANLIGNAIKFTETGSVHVEARVRADGTVLLSVIDTGPGIPAAHLPQIFDEFFQLRNPERDRSKGTGLGLAICKRLATALGCDLSVQSVPGGGSTFTITIPPGLRATTADMVRVPGGDSISVRLAGLPRTGHLAGRRILLVEDHHTTRRATAHLLQCEGAIVLTAENGRDALQILAHEDPEILLLDLMLPDIDGAEVLRQLMDRRKETLRRIFAVSGDVTSARHEQVTELGADGLIPKPISIARLIHTLTASIDDSNRDAIPAV